MRLPAKSTWVLKSGNRSDPTLVDKRNSPRKQKGDSSKLRFRNHISFQIDEDGITRVRSGDIQAHAGFLLGWVSLGIRSSHEPDKTAKLDKRTVLETDETGQPRIVDDHYVPARHDDWLIITGPLGYREEIGL